MSGDKGYSIRVATDDDKPAVVELLRHFFVNDEPLNSLAPTPMDPADVYSVRFLNTGLSLVATTSDGSIVGACVNTEGTPASYAKRTLTKQTTTNQHVKKVLTLLDRLEELADIWNKYGVDRFFDVRILCVHSSMRGKGLGKVMLQKSFQMAKEKGYKLVHMECTGVYSARISEQLGMECVCTITYKDYKDHTGQQIFHPPAPHTELKMFILKL